MRIATYNVEWFANLFDADDTLRDDDGWSGRWNVTRSQQIAALGTVFRALDADAIMVIEAPDAGRTHNAVTALENFSQRFGLRARIDTHLSQATPLMLMGDLNDGPGLDEFEDLFGRSSVEIILGAQGDHPLYDPHAARALGQRLGAMPTTSRFWIRSEKRFLQALLDYIMISPDLRSYTPVWRIWHPLDDPACWADAALRHALVTASDHFPVTVDIDI